MRVSAGAEVGVVAMRGRVGQLVAVGCPDGPELAVVPCQIIDGFRLETSHGGPSAIRTSQCRPRYPFMLAILPATVNRAESGSRPRCRREPRNDGEDPDQPPAPSSHLTTFPRSLHLTTSRPSPPRNRPHRRRERSEASPESAGRGGDACVGGSGS